MAKKRGLGRGLDALIPEKPKIEEENLEQVVMIKLKDITPSPYNPRKSFDDESIDSLAESIKLYGIIQPLVLVKNNDKYDIVAGERRYRAAKSINMKEVPAIVKSLTNKDKDMISMVENIQREDLNPYEEAMAYKNIMDEYNLTQLELSETIGKSRTYIANIVRLLSLDDDTIKELEDGNITSSQGRALLGIDNLEERNKYLNMLINKEITVNEIERKKVTRKRKRNRKDIFVKDLEEKMKERFGTKVSLNKSKNKWTVSIVFTSDEQIEEFIENYGIGE